MLFINAVLHAEMSSGIDKVIREPPSKFVSSEVEIQLACRLLFVDMEGLNDGRAVKTIVPQVNPRKMVAAFTLPPAHS